MAITARAVDSGSGINVLVDPGATGDMQIVKLAGSTIAGEELVGTADLGSEHALFVRPRPNVAFQSQASAGLTTASTAYSNGDAVGDGWTFTNMAAASGGTGRIVSAILVDKGDVIAGYELWFARASITFGTNNSAPSISDSDAEKIIGRVTCSPVRDLGGCRISYSDYLSLPYVCDATSLFVYAVCLNDHAVFTAVTDLYLTLAYEID